MIGNGRGPGGRLPVIVIELTLFLELMDYKPSIQMIELDENHFKNFLGVKICSSREILTGCLGKLTSYLMECKLDDEIRASYDDEEAHGQSFYFRSKQTEPRQKFLSIIFSGLDYKPSIQMIELDENHFRSLLGAKICSGREILTGCLGKFMLRA
ncbi:hypothetical protein Tco_0038052 [Tanacetum coccineum]